MAAKSSVIMSVEQVMAYLKEKGSETTKATLLKHGAPESMYGVKIADLNALKKKIKTDHSLALKLYETGNSDAMYFAGLICDPKQITKADLNRWIKQAPWYMISEYTVAWTAAESPHGWELAMKWIDSKQPMIAGAGWSTLSGIVSLVPDDHLDIDKIKVLVNRIEKEIRTAPNRVKYSMNGFLICVGSYVIGLTDDVKSVACKIGTVEVDMGATACKVPNALEYIDKVANRGTLGKKRKTVFC